MVGEDLFSPCDDGVDDFAVFGYLSGGVEIGEPSERLVSLIRVVGFIQLVELLESVPRGSQDVDERRSGVAPLFWTLRDLLSTGWLRAPFVVYG